MPQYELATYRELVEHETKKNQPPPLSRAERGILANLQAGRQPTQKADRARAEQLRKRGLVRVDSQGCYDLLDPVEEGSGCNFIWLPNEIVTGASLEQESPVRLLRSLGSVRPVRLFVNFYNAQNLRDDGGVDPRLIHQKFDRKMICERGAFTIWGFRPTSLSIRWTGLLAAPGSEAKEAPEENSTELDSLNLLLEMNLLSFVPHIYENDTDSAEPIHAFGIGGVSEDPLERNIGDAAQSAARACAPTQRLREAEKAGFNYFCPIPRSKPAAQMIGVARLPHRPQTRRTQAWSQHLRETTPRWIDFFENSVKSDERTVFQMPAKLA
jgi:hypothetical protein